MHQHRCRDTSRLDRHGSSRCRGWSHPSAPCRWPAGAGRGRSRARRRPPRHGRRRGRNGRGGPARSRRRRDPCRPGSRRDGRRIPAPAARRGGTRSSSRRRGPRRSGKPPFLVSRLCSPWRSWKVPSVSRPMKRASARQPGIDHRLGAEERDRRRTGRHRRRRNGRRRDGTWRDWIRPGRAGRFRRDRSGDVAEEPVVLVAGRDTAAKQEILVGARHHRPAQPERAGRGRAAVRRHHHRNAVAEGEVARTAGVRDPEPGGPARRAAVDDEPVGRRVIATQEGVHRDRATSSRVAGRRQDRARRSACAHVHAGQHWRGRRGSGRSR